MNWIAFLTSINLLFSYSARTARIQPNPFDFEYAFGIQKPGTLLIDLQQERENGKFYFDKEYMIQHSVQDIFLVRERFIEKNSKGLEYNQIDFRAQYKSFNFGVSNRNETGMKASWNFGAGLDLSDFHLNVGLLDFFLLSRVDILYDLNTYSVSAHNEVGTKILTNVSLKGVYKEEIFSAGKKRFFQYKLIAEFNIPDFNMKGRKNG